MSVRPAGLLPAITIFALVAPAIALAQDAGQHPNSSEAEIVVVGIVNQYKFSAKQIRSAVKAFDANKAQFAPNGALYFQVWASDPKKLSDLRIYLKSATGIVDLPLDDELKFTIPALPNDDWTLLSNKSRGRIVITPLVMSPGTSDGDRALGDLRLQCRVNWAISSPEISIFVRGMFSAAGGCSGNGFAYYATANHEIASAVVTSGAQSKALQVWRGNKYRVPVGDRKFGNEARVGIIPTVQ